MLSFLTLGNITRLKHELSLASRASAVSPSKEEEDKRKNSAVQTSNTTETNMTDDSKISEIKDDFQVWIIHTESLCL